MQGYLREEIEDFTGRMPYFLERCIENGKIRLDTPENEKVVRQATQFVNEMREKLSEHSWERQVSLFKHHDSIGIW